MGTKNIFKNIPDMGIIWVTDEAIKLGFKSGKTDWVNLGQGQPEFGEMKGAPDRVKEVKIKISDNAYGLINGTLELRNAIANHYNRLYRKNKLSKYTADNICVAMGGRLVLTQLFTTFDNIKLGYKTPEYPAYSDILSYHKGRIDAIHIPTDEVQNFSIPAIDFSKIIKANKLDAFLFSNPCNPTGSLIAGKDLEKYVVAANKNNCTLIIDEMYSHYIFEKNKPASKPVSSSAYVEDVNKDQLIIVDGLTKSFRYPGWRIAWAIGPIAVIANLNNVASSLDGGPSKPMQRAALKILEPKLADQETTALRKVFSRKKNIMIKWLNQIGITCSKDIRGTFYLWGDISRLPPPINQSKYFFEEALKHKVITVPGNIFNINQSNKHLSDSKFDNYIRFSFGPEEANIIIGLERIYKMVKSIK